MTGGHVRTPDPVETPRRGSEAAWATATRPLLDRVVAGSLDADYEHVARQRDADPAGRPAEDDHARRRRLVVRTLVLAMFALLVMTAFLQTSRGAEVDRQGRAYLADSAQTRRARLTALQDRAVALQQTVRQLTASLAAQREAAQGVAERDDRVGAASGYTGVRGPAVRLVVSDPPNADELVRDTDLRALVNGLWQAGAEAISINGQRLTPQTAIRNSGVVVHVNRAPLQAPYTVLAIGDTRTLQARLVESSGGARFLGLVDYYGFGFTVDTVRSQSLGAVQLRTPQYAVALGQSEDAGGRSGDQGQAGSEGPSSGQDSVGPDQKTQKQHTQKDGEGTR